MPGTSREGALRSRIRLVAASATLVGLAMVQSPGLVVPDTKLDLVTAPWRFLGRATHLWDGEGAFGQLQNQAYGYLWPMGPFHLLGALAGVPGWAVQRGWVALVMVVAFTGVVQLSRALGVRSDLACLVAGFAYALSPRMLTTLGPISIEAWPSALAPWVLLPLVIGSTRGSPRRAAALSALAVAMVGGVNAAATSAVLPLGAVWLLTRAAGPRRRTMMLWWPLFVLLGTVWWLVPLATLGSYSPPFLDYIESAANTTFPTALFDALRGTSNWVPYVDATSRAGNDLLRQWTLVVNDGVLLVLGAVGLLRRETPHRLFLVLGLLSGLFLVTMGHLGNVEGWAAGGLNNLLDGVLAPLRNVHKFDPVVRLPLVLGLAFVVEGLRSRSRAPAGPGRRGSEASTGRINATVLLVTAVIALTGSVAPALGQRLEPSGGFLGVPDYWQQTADWLDGEQGTALLVPGSSFGAYVWGTPDDEPMQSLARSDWAVRNAVPLTPPGNIRMLDAIERRLAQGEGSAGLAAFMRRAGITHLVVRNDLARSGDVPDPVLVHQAIAQTPGLARVQTFGPVVGGDARLLDAAGDDRVLVSGGWQTRYAAIEIFRVVGTRPPAQTATGLPVVAGGTEDLLDLADLGVVDDEPTQLAVDVDGAPDPDAPLVLTDGLRDTERNFGRLHDATSAVRVPGEKRTTANRERDYLPAGADRWTTHARVGGVVSLSASSSRSDADAGPVAPGELPYAAVDDDPDTQWRSQLAADPPWWQVELEESRAIETVTLIAGPGDRQIVQVRTDNTASGPIELQPGIAREVAVDDDGAQWLRVEDVSGRSTTPLSLAEVDVPGLTVDRSLVLPTLPAAWGNPDVVALRAARDARTGCALVDGDARCVESREVTSEEPTTFRRVVPLDRAAAWTPRLTALPRPGADLDTLIEQGSLTSVAVSSTGVRDNRASALAAVDGSLATTWIAALSDLQPRLDLGWLDERRIAGLRLRLDPDAPARLPNRIAVIWSGGRVEVDVDENGRARFPPIIVDALSIQVEEADPATSLDFSSTGSALPVGVGDVRLRGAPYFPMTLSTAPVALPCGTGPSVVVNGELHQSQVLASPALLYAGGAVPATLCGTSSLELVAGDNQVDVLASPTFAGSSLVLTAEGTSPDPAEVAPATLSVEGPARAVVTPGANGVLNLAQNDNAGWRAERGGVRLEPTVVDGWQQAWELDGSDGPVALSYTPDRGYRAGLVVGLLGLLLLAALCCAPGRRWPGRDRPALDERRVQPVALVVLAAGAGGVLAGWPGLLVALVAAAAARVAGRRIPEVAPWVLAAVLVPSVIAYAVQPWGDPTGWAGAMAWPQLGVVALCGCFVGLLPSRSRSRSRRRRRSVIPSAGISTQR